MSRKRLLDLALLLPLVPLFAAAVGLLALAVLVLDGRPVFFRQPRVGVGGREFTVLKLRTMTCEPDPKQRRPTRLGAWLRQRGLDELPQLFNVLRGDMSLVGPRPDVPAQRALYSDADWAQRCSVRPGITGLAQALLRSEGTEAQRLALDLRYTREVSVWFDLKIMAWTLGRLTGKGSN